MHTNRTQQQRGSKPEGDSIALKGVSPQSSNQGLQRRKGSMKCGPECTQGPRARRLQALAGCLAPSVCPSCQGSDLCGLLGERDGEAEV